MANIFSKYLSAIFLTGVCFCFCGQAMASRFDGVKKLRPDQRIAASRSVFSQYIQPADSLTAYTELAEFLNWAKQEKDHKLSITVLLFLAQYEGDLREPRSNAQKIIGFFDEAQKIATDNGLDLELAWSLHAKGTFYYYRKKFALAFENLFKANALFRKIGFEKVPGIYRLLMDVGLIYYDFNDQPNTLKYLLEATHFPPVSSWEEKMTLTAIGLVYRKQEAYDSAMYYFNKTLDVARKDKDSTWIGIASGNIGSVLMFRKQYNEAVPFLAADVRLCARAGEWASSSGSMIRLSQISIAKQEYAQALKQLDYADTMIAKIKDLDRRRDLYEQYAIVYEKLNEPSKALRYRNQYEKVKDSLDKRYSDKIYSDVQIRIETERHLANVKLLESEKSSALLKRNALILLLFLVMIISLLLLNRQRMRQKNEKLLFEKQQAILTIQTKAAQDELANATEQMGSYTENIRRKNELIDGFQTEIELLQKQLSIPLSTEKTEALEKLLHSTILTEEDWQLFKNLFDKVHKGFTTRLRDKLPELTQAEVRLVTLTRLGLSDREMAGMLGISIDTIRKTRQRLRKKLSASEQSSFEDLISTI